MALRKVGPREYPARQTAVFAVVARADKGMLADFRLAFAGETALRLREVEGKIVGRRLPLDARQRSALSEEYRAAAEILEPRLRIQFGTLVDGALEILAR